MKRDKEAQKKWNQVHGHDLTTVKKRKRRKVKQALQKASRKRNRK